MGIYYIYETIVNTASMECLILCEKFVYLNSYTVNQICCLYCISVSFEGLYGLGKHGLLEIIHSTTARILIVISFLFKLH